MTRSIQLPLPAPKKSPARTTMLRKRACCRQCAQLGFHLHADAALGGGGLLRRARAQQRRHLGAEVVHVARQHEGGVQPLGHREPLAEHRHRMRQPLRVQRVHRVHHHKCAGSRQGQRGRVGQIDREMRGATRQRRRRTARLRQHRPACGGKRLHGSCACRRPLAPSTRAMGWVEVGICMVWPREGCATNDRSVATTNSSDNCRRWHASYTFMHG